MQQAAMGSLYSASHRARALAASATLNLCFCPRSHGLPLVSAHAKRACAAPAACAQRVQACAASHQLCPPPACLPGACPIMYTAATIHYQQ